jgi:hypothetical protein
MQTLNRKTNRPLIPFFFAPGLSEFHPSRVNKDRRASQTKKLAIRAESGTLNPLTQSKS